jgi:hypothetical protein
MDDTSTTKIICRLRCAAGLFAVLLVVIIIRGGFSWITGCLFAYLSVYTTLRLAQWREKRIYFENLHLPFTYTWYAKSSTKKPIIATYTNNAIDQKDRYFHLRWMWMDEYGDVDEATLRTRTKTIRCLVRGQSHIVSMEFWGVTLIHFLQLPALAADSLLETWHNTSIFEVTFYELLFGTDVQSLDRWGQLCRTFGAISTLQVVRIGCVRGSLLHVATAVGILQHISHLALIRRVVVRRGITEDQFAELARALQYHPCLESLVYGLATVSYRDVIPALETMPSLKKISLYNVDGLVWERGEVAVEDAQALAAFLKRRELDALRIVDLRFQSHESSQAFCAGISQSRATCIQMAYVLVQDFEMLADALSLAYRMTELELRGWPHDACTILPAFLNALAQRLPSMNLVKLDLEDLATITRGGRDVEKVLLTVGPILPELVRAAATCSTLMELKLPCMYYSDAMDEALSYLVKSSDLQLRALVLCCPALPTGAQPRVSYPRFREAIKTNLTLTTVLLKSSQPGEQDPWCDDFKKDVAMVVRSNNSGRLYLGADSGQHASGYQLLENVNDDPNCLFFHLRENPALCRQLGSSNEQMIDDIEMQKWPSSNGYVLS